MLWEKLFCMIIRNPQLTSSRIVEKKKAASHRDSVFLSGPPTMMLRELLCVACIKC